MPVILLTHAEDIQMVFDAYKVGERLTCRQRHCFHQEDVDSFHKNDHNTQVKKASV